MGQPVLRRPAVETNPPLGVVPIARPRHVGAVLQHVSGLSTSVAVHLGRLPLVRTGSVTLGETRCASSPALSPLAATMLWPQKLGTTLFVRHLGFLLCGRGCPVFSGTRTMHISFSMDIIASSFLFQSSLSCQAFPFAFVGTFLGLFFKGREQGNHSDENVSDKKGTTAEPPNQLGRHSKMAHRQSHTDTTGGGVARTGVGRSRDGDQEQRNHEISRPKSSHSTPSARTGVSPFISVGWHSLLSTC